MTWNGHLGFQRQPSTPIEVTMGDLVYASFEGGKRIANPSYLAISTDKSTFPQARDQDRGKFNPLVSLRRSTNVKQTDGQIPLRARADVGRDVSVRPYATRIPRESQLAAY